CAGAIDSRNVPVAQRTEQPPSKRKVAGSNPAGGAILARCARGVIREPDGSSRPELSTIGNITYVHPIAAEAIPTYHLLPDGRQRRARFECRSRDRGERDMSDTQSEVNPASPEGESLNGSFSSNGNDQGAIATATDGAGEMSFLDDLAKAMRTTAATQQARDAELTDQRRQSHLDAIRAREALEAED